MGTPHEIDVLVHQVERGTEAEAVEAAKRLAETEAEDAVADLGRILRSTAQSHSKQAAAYALSWHKSDNAVLPLLESAADTQEEDGVRGQAIEGLAMHLQEHHFGSDLRTQAEDVMIHLLKSPSPTLRFWCCFGLGTLKCMRAVPYIRQLSQEDKDVCPGWWYVHEEAEDALERISGRPGAQRIPVHLRKPDSTE